MNGELKKLEVDVRSFIEDKEAGDFDELYSRIRKVQLSQPGPFSRFSQAYNGTDVPLPVEAFRHARIAMPALLFDKHKDQRVFKTSGTTSGLRGEHHFPSTSLYELAAMRFAEKALFPGSERYHVISLVAAEDDNSESSLGFMIARFAERFGERVSYVWKEGGLDFELLKSSCRQASEEELPVALLGTAFAFAFAEGEFSKAYPLPEKSRLMITGGFKGKVQNVDARQLLLDLEKRFALPSSAIVNEYGMTELSSQLYSPFGDSSELLHFPHWMRVRPTNVETLKDVEAGELGYLRFDDLANMHSAISILTGDLGRIVDGKLELHGRGAKLVARGCSLAVEEAMS